MRPSKQPINVVHLREAMRNLLHALKFAVTAHAWATIGLAVATFVSAAMPLSQAWVAKHIIDGVSGAVTSGNFRTAGLWAAVQPVLFWLVLELVLAVLSTALTQVRSLFEHVLNATLSHSLNTTIMRKALSLDLEHFEDAQFYDMLQNARREADRRTLMVLSTSFGVIQNLIQLLSFAVVLAAASPLVSLLLFGASLPLFVAQNKFSSLYFRMLTWRTQESRRLHYFESLLTQKDSAKEVKLFGLGEYILKRYDDIFWKFYREDSKLARERSATSVLYGMLSTAAFYGAYAWVVWQAVLGVASLGSMTMYIALFRQSQTSFLALLRQVNDLYESALFLTNLYSYLNLSPRLTTVAEPRQVASQGPHHIEFEHVSFQYPGQSTWALRDLCLTIGDGEKLALVGENGAGKTTFIKLLTRLYDPTEGRILLDGVDLREYDIASLHRTIGVIFQDFVKYYSSVAENIGFGDVDAVEDRVRIERAAQKGGADDVASELDSGYDTMLGQWFDHGRELSGGQWQKIALSRAFMRESAIVVLDEPTSALDAAREYEIFQRFRDLTAGRIAILISHRFSTVRMADRIAVIENGALTELGSHDELLALGGVYARLFNMQAEGYR